MLESKLVKAAQAIVKNNSLLICSGSGMAADCQLFENNRLLPEKIPIFRGTQGLWKTYPAFRKQLITFNTMVEERFFKM